MPVLLFIKWQLIWASHDEISPLDSHTIYKKRAKIA